MWLTHVGLLRITFLPNWVPTILIGLGWAAVAGLGLICAYRLLFQKEHLQADAKETGKPLINNGNRKLLAVAILLFAPFITWITIQSYLNERPIVFLPFLAMATLPGIMEASQMPKSMKKLIPWACLPFILGVIALWFAPMWAKFMNS